MEFIEGGGKEAGEESKEEVRVGEVKEGVASIALLPNGSLSGHFIQLPQSICYGLHGTGMVLFSFYFPLVLSLRGFFQLANNWVLFVFIELFLIFPLYLCVKMVCEVSPMER